MANNVKLLVVDDNPMVLAMLQQALAPLALVTTAADAADALLKAVDDVPDLLVCDYKMPGMDGRKTLEAIKQDDALKRIPVIILTTSADERDIQACYQTGANTYVQKPVSFEGLIEAIKRLKAYWFEIALLPKEAGHE